MHGALLRDDVCNLEMFRQSVIHSIEKGDNIVSEVVFDLQVYNAEGRHKSTYYVSYTIIKDLKLSF